MESKALYKALMKARYGMALAPTEADRQAHKYMWNELKLKAFIVLIADYQMVTIMWF